MNREEGLRKNYGLMGWIYAGFRLNAASSVLSLLYVLRGLSESNIFVIGAVFAASSLLLEVPSSYLADKIGRKFTLQLAIISKILYTVLLVVSDNLFWFAVSAVFYGASWAMYSGTDEALLYDTQKELGETKNSNKNFGKYLGSAYWIKALVIVVAGLVVNQIELWQFQAVVVVDIVVGLLTLFGVSLLTEPDRKMHLQVENILKSATRTLRDNTRLLKTALNQNIIFLAEKIPYIQLMSYFASQDVRPLTTNIFYGGCLMVLFFVLNKIEIVLPKLDDVQTINHLNKISLVLMFLTIPTTILNWPVLTLFLYVLFIVISNIRKPFFSTVMNKDINSHDRSTTLSLASFTKSFVQVPVSLLVAWLLIYNVHASFYVSLVLILVANLFFRVEGVEEV